MGAEGGVSLYSESFTLTFVPQGRRSPRRYDESIMLLRAAFAVFALLALSACGGDSGTLLPPLPMEAAGWKRAALEVPPVAEAPEQARALGVRSWSRTRYQRDGESLNVSAFAFASETAAFEAQQKWQRPRHTTTFYQGPLFLVCEAPTLTSVEMLSFTGALETEWLKPPQP